MNLFIESLTKCRLITHPYLSSTVVLKQLTDAADTTCLSTLSHVLIILSEKKC